MYKVSVIFTLLLAVFSQNIFGADEVTPEVDTTGLVPSLLLESVIAGNFEAIKNALDAKESIDLVNSNGWSAARFAVAGGDLDMLRFLIEQNIDLNNPDNEGVTPLMVAADQVCFIVFCLFILYANF